MIDLLEVEKSLVTPHIVSGGTAVDFTMGNGHDMLWLSKAVGEDGTVFAFDIQQQALDSTEKLLCENNISNVKLILDSHANVKNYVSEPICVGMFNLGYLPGGDKSITTKHESSIAAIIAGTELLAPNGALLIAVYPGHAEGTIEGNAVRELLSSYDRKKLCCSEFHIVNSPSSPFFYLVEKK